MQPYYEGHGVALWLGDCREVLPRIKPVDHVITDPPYGETTHAGARSLRGGSVHAAIDFDAIDHGELRGTFGLLQPRRWLLATVEWRHMLALEQQPPAGLRFVRFGVWVKPNGAPQFTGDRPATGWEAIAVLHRAGGRMRWNGGGRPAVFTYPVAQSGRHPTEKPLPLLRQLVALFTDPGEVILDPFAGSSTTLLAAAELGRRAIGIEISEQYAEVSARRLEGMTIPLGFAAAEQATQLGFAAAAAGES